MKSRHVPRPRIDPQHVPEAFRPLIPYAEKWAISDFITLRQAIDEAPLADLKEFVLAVSGFDAEGFDEWLGEPGAAHRTKAWMAFVLMVDACDLAKQRLEAEDEDRSTD